MRALDQPQGPPWPADDGTYFALPPPPPKPRDRVWLHVALLAATVLTTTFVGGCHYHSFDGNFVQFTPPAFDAASFWLSGLWYSVTVLAILGCHEMGHYLACRYYDVDASLPYFLPAPIVLTGTVGAFIRIRQRIPDRTALFDIGIAGPLAGFVVAVPALFLGLWLSRVVPLPPDFAGWELGEPLLFRAAAWLVFGDVPEGYSVNMHPMAFASWFGLLATALNLFPIAQLDGGHISYAVLGRRSSLITFAMLAVAIALTLVSTSWVAWTVLLVVMLFMVGPHHPPTLYDEAPVDGRRVALAVLAIVILIVCFTPAPIEQFVATP